MFFEEVSDMGSPGQHSGEKEGRDGGVGFGASRKVKVLISCRHRWCECNNSKGRGCAGPVPVWRPTAGPPSLCPDVPETLQVTWYHCLHSR